MIDSLYTSFQCWSEKGAVFIIADLHLGESEDLRRVYLNRPIDKDLVKKVNSIAGRGSTLIVCGDIGTDLELIGKLRANVVLLRGNHDHLGKYYKDVISEFYEGPLIISPKIILSHEPFQTPYLYNIHGHNHAGPQYQYGSMNVCADVINYTPVNLNQFIKSGKLKEYKNIHQETIDEATKRAKKRGKKSHI